MADLDPERRSREEEMNNTVKTLGMFEFGSWQEATSKAGKARTATKWVGGVKRNDDGPELVRCRLVARDFKPRREGKEGIIRIRGRGAREETRTGTK